MRSVIRAVNIAVKKLPAWKKLILISLYPVVLIVAWFIWRAEDKLTKSQGKKTE